MLTFGAGSRKIKSGWSGDEFQGFQSTEERRLLELYGIVGLPVFAKFTEYTCQHCNDKQGLEINIPRASVPIKSGAVPLGPLLP
jgi:hypothetical protein